MANHIYATIVMKALTTDVQTALATMRRSGRFCGSQCPNTNCYPRGPSYIVHRDVMVVFFHCIFQHNLLRSTQTHKWHRKLVNPQMTTTCALEKCISPINLLRKYLAGLMSLKNGQPHTGILLLLTPRR
jgi:hypothetical protein